MSRSPHNPLAWIEPELDQLARRGLRRALVTHDGAQRVRLEVDGRELVNFGSNDYLGLAADPRLASVAAAASLQAGSGSGASPLVTGHATAHRQLERDLAAFAAAPAGLVFASGYAANLGTIAALAGVPDAIYSDQKNHASIIDGCRLSRATVHIYPHRDWRALESLLARRSSLSPPIDRHRERVQHGRRRGAAGGAGRTGRTIRLRCCWSTKRMRPESSGQRVAASPRSWVLPIASTSTSEP